MSVKNLNKIQLKKKQLSVKNGCKIYSGKTKSKALKPAGEYK